MIGRQKFSLPGARRSTQSQEAQEAVESSGEPVRIHGAFEALEDAEIDEHYEEEIEDDYYDDDEDDYYFSTQKEASTPAPQPATPAAVAPAPAKPAAPAAIAPAKPVEQKAPAKTPSDADYYDEDEEWEDLPEYHPLDFDAPVRFPPGFYLASLECVLDSSTWTWASRILHFIGIGNPAKRFDYPKPKNEGDQSDVVKGPTRGARRNRERKMKERPIDNIGGEVMKSDAWKEVSEALELDFSSETLPDNEPRYNPLNMGFGPEDDPNFEYYEGPDVPHPWFFWKSPRWEAIFGHYEPPSSVTGAIAQLFYRFFHFIEPESREELEYETGTGDINLGPWFKWFFFHPCWLHIGLNWFLIYPFTWIRPIRRRLKVTNYRILYGKTLLTDAKDHAQLLLRRFPFRRQRRRFRKWRRWTFFFTFVFSPNCWDLFGHDPRDTPTDDLWLKNYIHNFTGGLPSDPKDLGYWLSQARLRSPTLHTPPNVEALKQYEKQLEKLKLDREAHRKELFGNHTEQDEEWRRLRQMEYEHRERQLQGPVFKPVKPRSEKDQL